VTEAGRPLATFRVDGRAIEAADGRFSVRHQREDGRKLSLGIEADGYQPLTVERDDGDDLGDLVMKEAQRVTGTVVDPAGQPVFGAEVTCDQCTDSTTSAYDGTFSLTAGADASEPTVAASKLNQRGRQKGVLGQSLTVTLDAPVRVEGVVK